MESNNWTTEEIIDKILSVQSDERKRKRWNQGNKNRW